MKTDQSLAHITAEAGKVVIQAGRYIASEFGKVNSESIHLKGHNSLVSHVDQTAERMLVEGLMPILPEAGFLTEEETIVAQPKAIRWIIDPLDGTTNFLHGVPLFCVSVALEMDGELKLGLVYDVMGQQLFRAWTGGGSWCNDRPIRVSKPAALSETLVATGFPYYDYVGKEAYLKVLGELMEGTRGLRRLGSAALDLAWTAAGRFDGFFEYSLHPWDVAGGAVLVREAGGVVTDFWGGDDFMADKTLIAGSPEMILWLHNQINIYFSRD